MVNSRAFKKMMWSDITRLKNKYVGANIICPILQIVLTKETAVVDHKHITRKEIKEHKTGEDGKGLLRGVIHDQANVFVGKIEKGFVRSGCHKFPLSISEQLRLVADYLEDPPLPQNMIHAGDRIKPPKLSQRDYKKICKYWFKMFPRSRTLPKYPPGVGKKKIRYMTPKWIGWLNQANELAAPKKKRQIKRIK